MIKQRRDQGLNTKMKDLTTDVVASRALRANVREGQRRRQSEQACRRSAQLQAGTSKAEPDEGAFECFLKTTILTKAVEAVVDTGASHSIVAYRTIQRLKLGELIKATKKAFLTAGGELTFPVGEIEALPMKVGGDIVPVSCMVVAKACFALLVRLDVLKVHGAVIDLKRSLFTFDSQQGRGPTVTVALSCERVRHTLEDVQMIQAIGAVRMIHPIPAALGPQEGLIAFPELDEGAVDKHPAPSTAKPLMRFPIDVVIGTEVLDAHRL